MSTYLIRRLIFIWIYGGSYHSEINPHRKCIASIFSSISNIRQKREFFLESLCVLERGGKFRVGVPDTEWPILAYANGDSSYFTLARDKWHPGWCDTRMHNINFHFRQGAEHKYAYDYETMEKVLAAAGFSSIVRTDFDPTVDSEARRTGTLYVEARKPD